MGRSYLGTNFFVANLTWLPHLPSFCLLVSRPCFYIVQNFNTEWCWNFIHVVREGREGDFDQSDTRESHIVVVQFIFTDVHWWVSTPLLHIRTYWQTRPPLPQPLNIFPHNHQSLAIWPFLGLKLLLLLEVSAMALVYSVGLCWQLNRNTKQTICDKNMIWVYFISCSIVTTLSFWCNMFSAIATTKLCKLVFFWQLIKRNTNKKYCCEMVKVSSSGWKKKRREIESGMTGDCPSDNLLAHHDDDDDDDDDGGDNDDEDCDDDDHHNNLAINLLKFPVSYLRQELFSLWSV